MSQSLLFLFCKEPYYLDSIHCSCCSSIVALSSVPLLHRFVQISLQNEALHFALPGEVVVREREEREESGDVQHDVAVGSRLVSEELHERVSLPPFPFFSLSAAPRRTCFFFHHFNTRF